MSFVVSQSHAIVVGCRGAKIPQMTRTIIAHRSDEAGAFTSLLPAERLAKIGSNERSRDAELVRMNPDGSFDMS